MQCEATVTPAGSPDRPGSEASGRSPTTWCISLLVKYGSPCHLPRWMTRPLGVVKMTSEPQVTSHHLSISHDIGARLMLLCCGCNCNTASGIPLGPRPSLQGTLLPSASRKQSVHLRASVVGSTWRSYTLAQLSSPTAPAGNSSSVLRALALLTCAAVAFA